MITRNIFLKSFIILYLTIFSANSPCIAQDFALGGDISGTTEDEANGRITMLPDGTPMDIPSIMKEYGSNTARIRVWVNPEKGFSSPEDVVALAKRCVDLGMDIMIDFHYSDWWADPGKQNIPSAWIGLDDVDMANALADHTKSTLKLLRDNGIDVKWVQIGNETTNGFLWPIAKLPDNPRIYARFTQAGYNAAKEIFPHTNVIVHLDNGFDQALYDKIFDELKSNGAKWDIIGMSIYPYWAMESGKEPDEESTLIDAISNINHLKKKYGTDIMIVETGVDARNPDAGYAFMKRLLDAALNETDGACKGVIYWAPEINADAQYHLGAFANDKPTHIMDAFKEIAQKLYNENEGRRERGEE